MKRVLILFTVTTAVLAQIALNQHSIINTSPSNGNLKDVVANIGNDLIIFLQDRKKQDSLQIFDSSLRSSNPIKLASLILSGKANSIDSFKHLDRTLILARKDGKIDLFHFSNSNKIKKISLGNIHSSEITWIKSISDKPYIYSSDINKNLIFYSYAQLKPLWSIKSKNPASKPDFIPGLTILAQGFIGNQNIELIDYSSGKINKIMHNSIIKKNSTKKDKLTGITKILFYKEKKILGLNKNLMNLEIIDYLSEERNIHSIGYICLDMVLVRGSELVALSSVEGFGIVVNLKNWDQWKIKSEKNRAFAIDYIEKGNYKDPADYLVMGLSDGRGEVFKVKIKMFKTTFKINLKVSSKIERLKKKKSKPKQLIPKFEYVSNCPTGKYFDGKKCAKCHPKCKDCQNNSNNCIDCKSGFFLKNANCLKCHKTCLECNNNGAKGCTVCKQGSLGTDGRCTNNPPPANNGGHKNNPGQGNKNNPGQGNKNNPKEIKIYDWVVSQIPPNHKRTIAFIYSFQLSSLKPNILKPILNKKIQNLEKILEVKFKDKKIKDHFKIKLENNLDTIHICIHTLKKISNLETFDLEFKFSEEVINQIFVLKENNEKKFIKINPEKKIVTVKVSSYISGYLAFLFKRITIILMNGVNIIILLSILVSSFWGYFLGFNFLRYFLILDTFRILVYQKAIYSGYMIYFFDIIRSICPFLPFFEISANKFFDEKKNPIFTKFRAKLTYYEKNIYIFGKYPVLFVILILNLCLGIFLKLLPKISKNDANYEKKLKRYQRLQALFDFLGIFLTGGLLIGCLHGINNQNIGRSKRFWPILNLCLCFIILIILVIKILRIFVFSQKMVNF